MPDRRFTQSITHVKRDLTLMGNEIAAFSHTVYQIVDGINIRQQRRKLRRPVQIDLMTADVGQLLFVQPFNATCHRQYLMSLLAERLHQMLTNVTTGAKNHYALRHISLLNESGTRASGRQHQQAVPVKHPDGSPDGQSATR